MKLFSNIVSCLLVSCGVLISQDSDWPGTELSAKLKLNDLKQLAEKNKKVEVYRLLVGRSFHAVLMFEIESEAIFVRKVRESSEEDGSSSTLRLVRDSRLSLEGHEFRTLASLVEAGSFWDLPAEDWQPLGLDGSSWKLEGVKGGKYHCIVRSNPFLQSSLLKDEMAKLSSDRAYSEGRIIAAFIYLWTLSGEANEELY